MLFYKNQKVCTIFYRNRDDEILLTAEPLILPNSILVIGQTHHILVLSLHPNNYDVPI